MENKNLITLTNDEYKEMLEQLITARIRLDNAKTFIASKAYIDSDDKTVLRMLGAVEELAGLEAQKKVKKQLDVIEVNNHD